jgi:hypothetical protein
MTPKSKEDTWKYRVPQRGSTAVEALEAAWDMLRTIIPEVPVAVLALVDSRSRSRTKGYFAGSTWKKRRGAAHEIGISPRLFGQPEDLLATMLHEAAHAVLHETGDNGGMGSTKYYHTQKFRDKCVAFGLHCEFRNTRYGWTVTSWPAHGTDDRYTPILDMLRRNLPAGIGGRQQRKMKGRKLPATGHTMLACGCDNGRRTIYVKQSVLNVGGVMCSICGREFKRSP